MDDLDLATRTGLPPTLRTLLEAHPRAGWEAHPAFGPLTRFWLERHLGFRRLLEALSADARARVDGGMDARDHAVRLRRLGGAFLQGLEEHHGVEDHHYFPRLAALAPSLERGFALLDADHHRLHEEIEALAAEANAVLRGGAAGPLAERLEGMGRFLDRHLTDEEEVVVPVLLEVGEGAV